MDHLHPVVEEITRCMHGLLRVRDGQESDFQLSPDHEVASFDLGILRFDDEGNPVVEDQLEQIVDTIERRQSESPSSAVIVVFYCHGWNHDASWNDENLSSVKNLLFSLALRELERSGGGQRRVIGVYVGWAGLLYPNSPRQRLTFWSRYRAAGRIGRSEPFQRTVGTIISRTKELNSDSPVVLAGHSLGAMILESGLQSVLAPSRKGESRVPSRFPDLVLLINPAAVAGISKKIRRHIQDRIRDIPTRRIASQTTDVRAPLFIMIASESDRVTQFYFRAGTLRRTDGNTRRLHTHTFVHHRSPVTCRPRGNYSFGQHWHALRIPWLEDGLLTIDIDLPSDGDPLLDRGTNHQRYRLKQRRLRRRGDASQAEESPFWMFRLPRAICDGHNDIFNPRFASLLMALIQLSGATFSLASSPPDAFEREDYDERDCPFVVRDAAGVGSQ